MRPFLAADKLIIILAGICATVALQTHWEYPDRVNNGTEPSWGGKCDAGKRQSPIDLYTTSSFKGEFHKFEFKNYDVSLRGTTFVNTGHSVQVIIPEDKQIEVSGGGLPGTYIFEQMHWHWWSEHTIDGLRYPLEIHLVHRNTKYANVSEAVQYKNGVAVFGVLFHITDDIYEPLTDVLNGLPSIEDKVGSTTTLANDITTADFLPADTKKYFRYEGSLTTPDCDEAVVWTVFEDTIPVTIEQVEEFKYVRKDDGAFLESNYRSIQASYNRAIIYVDRELEGRNSQVQLSACSIPITILAVLLVLRSRLD